MKRLCKRWTKEEDSTLIQCVKDCNTINEGCRKASLILGRSTNTIRVRWFTVICKEDAYEDLISKKEFITIKNRGKERRNNRDDIIISCVKNNIDNLNEAFREASNKTGYNLGYIRDVWYTELSNPESPKYRGTCFLTLSNKRYNHNRKNPSATISTNVKTHGEKSAFKAIWTRLKNFLKLS